MSLTKKRIDNVLKAISNTKDPEMIRIWERKLIQLFDKRKAKAYERSEDQARMVHQRSAGVGNFNRINSINDCIYCDDV